MGNLLTIILQLLCTHTRTHIHTHARTHTHACMHARMHMDMHTLTIYNNVGLYAILLILNTALNIAMPLSLETTILMRGKTLNPNLFISIF